MSQPEQYCFLVTPIESVPGEPGTPWTITSQSNSDEDVLIKLQNGEKAVLLYTLEPNCQNEWRFSENGTLYTKAEDNFNYNLSSIVLDEGNQVEVTIEAVNLDFTLTSDDIKSLVNNEYAMQCELTSGGDATVDFRLIAEKVNMDNCSPKTAIRYFSQDPRVVIRDLDPT